MKNAIFILSGMIFLLLLGCAGERQGLVCEEMEYRLNTMTYSPDQRAYAEEELRVCREEEAQKKAAGAAQRKSIYDRYAATDSASVAVGDSSGASQDISVSEALKDSSGQETVSIYDRYGSKNESVEGGATEASAAEEVPADTSASDASSFQ